MLRINLAVAILLTMIASVVAQPADQWLREYGEEDHDQGWAICTTSDNGLVFVGVSDAPNRLFMTKVDDFGNLQWHRESFLTGKVRDIVETDDGGFVVVGSKGNNGLVAKLDAYGNALWYREIAPGPPVEVEAVTLMPNGGIVVTGRQDIEPVDLLIARYDAGGNNLWTYNYESLTQDAEIGFDVDYSPSGAIVVFATAIADGIGPNRIHTLLFDNSGQYLDGLFFVNINQSVLAGMVLDDGDFIIAGEREGEALAMRYSPDGVQQWEVVDPTGTAFIGCEELSDGGFAFSGSAAPFGHTDFYVMKTDAMGTVEWTERSDRMGNNYPKGMAVGVDDAIYTIGFSDNAMGPSDTELWAVGKEERYSEYIATLNVFNPTGTIPAEGGQLDYQLFLNNTTLVANQVQLHREGFTPNQVLLPIAEYPVILQPGVNPGFGTQYVPGNLEPGPYTFVFRLTTIDTDSLLATASYAFRKLAPEEEDGVNELQDR